MKVSAPTKAGPSENLPLKWTWAWAGVLSVLWLVAAAFSCHNDLFTIAWASHFIPGQWNVYDAVAQVREGALDRMHYPPLFYWATGVWMWLGKAAFGLFNHPEWDTFMARCDLEHSFPLTGAEIFYLKALYIPFFIGIGVLASRLTPSGNAESVPGWICWTHPVILFIPLFMGQFDVMPVLFCLLGVWLFLRGPSLGMCLLGFGALAVGTLLKNFPAVLAAAYFAIFMVRKEWRRGALYGLVFYLLILGTVFGMAWSPAFLKSYLGFQEMGLIFLLGRTSTAGTFVQYLGIALILAVLLGVQLNGRYALSSAWKRFQDNLGDPLRVRLTLLFLPSVLMGLILFDRFWHPQYMVWIVPWVVLLGLYGPLLWPEGHPVGSLIRRSPAVLSILFFPVAFARYVGKVDSNLLAPSAVGATLGAWLRPQEVFLTFLFSSLLLWVALASLATLFRIWLEPKPIRVRFKISDFQRDLPSWQIGGFLILILVSYLVGTSKPG